MTTTLHKLAELAGGEIMGDGSATVESITLDSRLVEPEGLFAAVPGTRTHGAEFASSTPAKAVITDAAGLEILRGSFDRPIIVVPEMRAILGNVSAEIYGHPTKKLTVIGVTGTSGKTTTTYLLEAGLLASGYSTGLIGTTGTRINRQPVETKLTTPEAPTLQALFARMVRDGVTHVVMEVSSHALALGRVQGVDFAVGGFTNLTQDHLDFHPSMEDYFYAKSKLFVGSGAAHHSVICTNDSWGKRLADLVVAEKGLLTVVSTAGAITGQTEINTEKIAQTMQARIPQKELIQRSVVSWQCSVEPTGEQQVALDIKSESKASATMPSTEQLFNFRLPLPGDFNIANAALAIGIASAADIDVDVFISALTSVAVPGRMQRIDEGQDFIAVVDYAHKPAAIEAVLDTLRAQLESTDTPHSGRVGVVVGAGGDRDSSKRGLMGAAAAKRADFVVVTDDNPRTEDPAPIRQAVLAGARKAAQDTLGEIEIIEVPSRADAIDAVVQWARAGDAVIVVGKGHEVGQLVGQTMLHFDDREELSRALKERKGTTVNGGRDCVERQK